MTKNWLLAQLRYLRNRALSIGAKNKRAFKRCVGLTFTAKKKPKIIEETQVVIKNEDSEMDQDIKMDIKQEVNEYGDNENKYDKDENEYDDDYNDEQSFNSLFMDELDQAMANFQDDGAVIKNKLNRQLGVDKLDDGKIEEEEEYYEDQSDDYFDPNAPAPEQQELQYDDIFDMSANRRHNEVLDDFNSLFEIWKKTDKTNLILQDYIKNNPDNAEKVIEQYNNRINKMLQVRDLRLEIANLETIIDYGYGNYMTKTELEEFRMTLRHLLSDINNEEPFTGYVEDELFIPVLD